MESQRRGCKCSECPLTGSTIIESRGPMDAPVLFLGEAPAEYEVKLNEPFVGNSGVILKLALQDTKFPLDDIAKGNVIQCRLPADDIADLDSEVAFDKCKAGLEIELYERAARGLKVVCALGQTAMRALGIDGKVTNIHGSVFPYEIRGKHLWVVPTFHPSFVIRSHWKLRGGGDASYYAGWLADFKKTLDIGFNGWAPLREDFNIFPTVGDVVDFCENALAKGLTLAVDTETTGVDHYDEKTRCWVLGLADGPEHAISVPFFDQGGAPYWKTPAEFNTVMDAVQRALSGCKLIFQNALFDIRILRKEGLLVDTASIAHDTLILHAIVSPESRHDLGSIVAEYGNTPFWKDMDWKQSMPYRDQVELRKYNLRDCVVLHQVVPPMLEDLEKLGARDAYFEEALPLISPILRMSDAGVYFDSARQDEFQKVLAERKKVLIDRLQDIHEKPPAFSYGSSQDVAYWLYGIVGSKFTEARKKLASERAKARAKLEEGRKKRDEQLAAIEKKKSESRAKGREPKITKRELELRAKTFDDRLVYSKLGEHLAETVGILESCAPIYVPPGFQPPRTEKGAPAVDKSAIITFTQAINKRLSDLDSMVRDHSEEEDSANRCLDWLGFFAELQKVEKLSDAFTKYVPKADGRIHPSWNQTGTVSGRMSSSGPNLQQIPKKGEGKEVRRFFKAAPGKVLVSADFENAEVALLGYEANDPIIIGAYERGESIHAINSMTLFGVGPEDPRYDTVFKPAAKIAQFGGFSYGGKPRTIYRQILIAVPDFRMSLREWEAAVRAWMAEHREYVAWKDRVTKKALEERLVCNAFGRTRLLLGNDYDITKQAMNHMIQSACGSLINRAWVRIEKRVPEGAVPTFQIHDQLVYECWEKDVDVVAEIIKEEMGRPFLYRGVERYLRAEVEVGPNLGDLEKWEGPNARAS